MIGKLVAHYRILERIGEGGMGVVYKAEDTRLKRTVALKFLPSELTRDEAAKQRFIHEAQAASALQHNNICNIHDIDETDDGKLFIVMDCYEGESLKEKLARGPLKLQEAVDIAAQVVGGLSKAHEKGIVHRDIKPGNIIITNDRVAKILDFGLAKLAGQAKLTKTGSTVGTAAYMSPEQAQGMEVDHRTDIWSVGIVLYEMLTGKLPFRGEHEAALMYSIVHEEPQAISRFRVDVPGGLASIINKALQKDRTQRYQTLKEVVSELKSAIAPGVELPKQEKSIVVLPFENLSSDPDQEYFSDGLTEELIATLSKVRALRIISRTTAMLLRGSRKDVPTIAQELKVRYVLEGSVRRAGNNIRITSQLIDAPADTHVWADAYTGTLEDIFGIQERVARAIAAALRVTLDASTSAKLAERPIEDATAYDYYLRAIQSIYQWTEAGLARAVEHLERAIKIEADSSLLYGALAYAYYQHANLGIEPAGSYRERARDSANKAFALDPETPLAHLTSGLLSVFESPAEGIRSFKRVLQTDPNHVETLFWLAFTAGFACRPEVGRRYAQLLASLDPLHPATDYLDGILVMCSGEFEQAARALQNRLRSTRQQATLYYLALSLAYLGRREDACPLFDESFKDDQRNVFRRFALVFGHVLRDERDSAWHILHSDLDISPATRHDFGYALWVAECHALLGDRTGALEWVERSVGLGLINYPFLSQHDPFLANIRGEERFKKLMEQVKKEWEEFEV